MLVVQNVAVMSIMFFNWLERILYVEAKPTDHFTWTGVCIQQFTLCRMCDETDLGLESGWEHVVHKAEYCT